MGNDGRSLEGFIVHFPLTHIVVLESLLLEGKVGRTITVSAAVVSISAAVVSISPIAVVSISPATVITISAAVVSISPVSETAGYCG